jgi:hypothetical protein
MSNSNLLKFVWQYFASHNDDMIVIRKSLIDICDGDFNCAMLISHLLYWHNKYHDMDRWMKITYEEWYEQCRLTERKLKNAKQNAKDLGLVEIKVKRFDKKPCLHFKINFENLTKALENYIEKSSNSGQNIQNHEMDETSKTEMDETSRTLTENTKHSRNKDIISESDDSQTTKPLKSKKPKQSNDDIQPYIDIWNELTEPLGCPQQGGEKRSIADIRRQIKYINYNWENKLTPDNFRKWLKNIIAIKYYLICDEKFLKAMKVMLKWEHFIDANNKLKLAIKKMEKM